MSKVNIPQGYRPPLTGYEMQRAIEFIKSNFQLNLCRALNLRRVSAPLFVDENSGLNDNLNGFERPVTFDIPDVGANGQVVHSLAKWKRLALQRYGFRAGKGLYTDMNAIRRDEEVDNLHSVYVDQWDWEKIISPEDRNTAFLQATVRAIAGAIADLIGANRAEAERAATLAKADLRTLMVGEFPELQGIMGEYYAHHDKEADDVALAIREHYQPRYAGDALPSTPVSLAVALADKLETLVGLFGIGQLPTGEKDPFALRRHALGVLRMLIEKELHVSLPEMIDAAWAAEKEVPGVTDNRPALAEFFADRLRVMLRDRGATAQEADAILALNLAKLADIPKRLAAVQAFMALPESEALSAANKRIGNILKKVEGHVEDVIDISNLKEDAEKRLFEELSAIEPEADVLYAEGRFEEMLVLIAKLRAPVDAFFESVMVNAEDPALRANRLALLKRLYLVMNRVAEIARLAK